jgi:hypothetical protein
MVSTTAYDVIVVGLGGLSVTSVRDLETIDSELRLLAAVRCVREHGGQPSSHHVDELLDERNELTGSFDRA